MKHTKIFAFILAALLSASALCACQSPSPDPADTTPAPEIAETTPIFEPFIEPIYSIESFQSMNAVIVKWGKQNKACRKETETYVVDKKPQDQEITYVGVDVEFIKIFDQTMKKSNYTNFLGNISKTDFLMIPEQYLEYAQEGQTSLVFLDLIYIQGQTSNTGSHVVVRQLGVRLGELISEGEFACPPIFQIENDKILVPEEAYLTEKFNGSYYLMSEMYTLQSANEYVQKVLGESLRFENGMSTPSLDEYFTLICK